MKREEKMAIVITITMAVALIVFAYIAQAQNMLVLFTLCVGGLGGLVHEIAQSGGKFMIPKLQDDGYYLGSIAGILLGSICGFLLLKGFLEPGESAEFKINYMAIGYDTLVAGLGLKGLTEALSRKSVKT